MIQGNNAPMTLRSVVQSFVARAARLFPTELLHEIITLILSRYLSDVLIAPASTRSWDAIGTLLHVDYHFRSCTLSVLNPLWDGDFVDRKTGCVFLTRYPGVQTQKRRNQIKAPTKLYPQDRILAWSCRICTYRSKRSASPNAPCTFYAPEHSTVRAYRTLLRCMPSADEHDISRR